MSNIEERRQLIRAFYAQHGVAAGENPSNDLIEAAHQHAEQALALSALKYIAQAVGCTTSVERGDDGEDMVVISRNPVSA